jgi:hypothetical protein
MKRKEMYNEKEVRRHRIKMKKRDKQSTKSKRQNRRKK